MSYRQFALSLILLRILSDSLALIGSMPSAVDLNIKTPVKTGPSGLRSRLPIRICGGFLENPLSWRASESTSSWKCSAWRLRLY